MSTNTLLLRAASHLVSKDVTFQLFEKIGLLPHFNPDIESIEIPVLSAYRRCLKSADGILFSSPEYAHGLPGSLKNALDWVVGSGELVGKPVAIFNPSPRSAFATASLKEILVTMDTHFIEQACLTIPLAGLKLTEEELLQCEEFIQPIQEALTNLISAIKA
jgi:chromate reductase, NAD(P)H dehydrogenase (quinone)